MLETGPRQYWTKLKALRQAAEDRFEPDHPARVALRAYGLTLALSLGPALVPFITQPLAHRRTPGHGGRKLDLEALVRLVRKQLRYDGFAFAMTVAVAGGPWLRELWRMVREPPSIPRKEENGIANGHSPPARRPLPSPLLHLYIRLLALARAIDAPTKQLLFMTNAVAALLGFILLRSGKDKALQRRNLNVGSSTLDLTLLLVVRAVDGLLQTFIRSTIIPVAKVQDGNGHSKDLALDVAKTRAERYREKLSVNIDAITFWICGSRIMWCWFYQPERLPHTYVKWISALANVDERFLQALRHIRTGEWSYFAGSPKYSHILQTCSADLGFPAAWGNPSVLPAYGGKAASEVWKQLGVTGRSGVGGIPCDLVHGTVGQRWGLQGSCQANILLRAAKAFLQSLAIYAPVHFIPILLTCPKSLLSLSRFLHITAGALRSTSFLTSFLTLNWYTVCLVRTVVFARLFPNISHQFWDGPHGAVLAGCFASGASIWLEKGKRRAEMALYVLPKALRTCLPTTMGGRWARLGRMAECIAFVLSLSALLQTAATHPTSLRGLSRWASGYVLQGSGDYKTDYLNGETDR
ncbi:integral membrane protein [Coprinopsis sp. MPI-PUGE-AT-0042]|nr:integral membrane protein [Coprinopsis sp. MPI-PUGE-AT-0042]